MAARITQLQGTILFNSRRWMQHGTSLREFKLAMIDAEIELKRLTAAHTPVTPNLSADCLEYLTYVAQTKRHKKLTWLDTSYRKRARIYEKISEQQHFDGLATTFLPFGEREVEKIVRRKQLTQIGFASSIVFDISFDAHMSSLEAKNLAEQLVRIFYFNKTGNDQFKESGQAQPFNIHLAGLDTSDKTLDFLEHIFDKSIRKFFPNVFFHHQSITELFPRDKLVYLSPHAEETLEVFDPECSYIIGGIVDRREIIELTPNKIKSLGLRSAKLPTTAFHHKHVQSLHDVFKIFYDLKNCSTVDADVVSGLANKYLPKKRS